MAQFIQEVGIFVGGLLEKILNIPMYKSLSLGIVLTIVILVCLIIRYFRGGKGD